jgi:signal peptidase II
MTQNIRRWLLLLALIAGVLAVDTVTKEIVLQNLELGESTQPIPAIAEVFQITRSYNTGAAFGLLPTGGDLFLVIALVVVVIMFIAYPRIDDDADTTRFALGLIIGGALGNALDRIRHDHVVDFIHYQIPGVISNVSNLADHAIVIGVILVLIDNWRLERKERREAAPAATVDTEQDHP